MKLKTVVVLLLLLGAPIEVRGDSNLHQLTGTLTDCWCEFIPDFNEEIGVWFCYSTFEIAAPTPHYSPENPVTVTVEIVEQAVGQCGETLFPLLPRQVRASFWVDRAELYINHLNRRVTRSPVRVYYLEDLGAP